jgi:hypothetical protein
MLIIATAFAHHWQRVYDESVVVHEVQEVFGHVCCFGSYLAMISLVVDMFVSALDFSLGLKRKVLWSKTFGVSLEARAYLSLCSRDAQSDKH